ncbi:MAG: EAL domain-containing protein [Burkholderiales bacterium]
MADPDRALAAPVPPAPPSPPTPGRLTLRAKLFFGFLGFVLLVLANLLFGDHVMRAAASRLDSATNDQVRPLVRLNRLQAQISRIRVLEADTPLLSDLFAVSDRLGILEAEIKTFDADLAGFTGELRRSDPAEAAQLALAWSRYRADLETVIGAGKALDMATVRSVATFESAERFKAIARHLKRLADGAEARADALMTQAGREQTRQRLLFIGTSVLGLAALAVWVALLSRSVTNRVTRLRDAALQVAEGEERLPLQTSGNDELTDLGLAFNAMQDKVQARELALRAAHDELDSRVIERTRELDQANHQLRREIDERRRVEDLLKRQATIDALTGLPNRVLVMDRLGQALIQARRDATQVLVIFVDLDDFKKVNDSLGHAAGDALLVQAAQRLLGAVRRTDTVARLGGDEFLVVMGGIGPGESIEAFGEALLTAFLPPFDVGDGDTVITPSMGFALYPDDGDEPSLLLRNADLAMYEAKRAGRNTWRQFRQQAHESSMRRLAIERQLRQALPRAELRLEYQAVVAAADSRLVGVEALLRWDSPDEGLVPPGRFIPVAERTGLIVDIGDWVIREACARLRHWRGLGAADLWMSVNVSPRQFAGGRLLATLRECLAEHALPGESLQIEVTEGSLIRNPSEVLQTLEAISALGVRLAMDDFGTGYSSLSYLKRYPFTTLKIDRSFVRNLEQDRSDLALVTAAVRMGKGLGLSVVAEGVETTAQRDLLAAQDCDLLQGYLFSRPAPAEAFLAQWLRPGEVPSRV